MVTTRIRSADLGTRTALAQIYFRLGRFHVTQNVISSLRRHIIVGTTSKYCMPLSATLEANHTGDISQTAQF